MKSSRSTHQSRPASGRRRPGSSRSTGSRGKSTPPPTSAGDRTITTVDADGVALAAIQGLNQKLTGELNHRDAENAELKRGLEAVKEIIRHQKSN